MKPVQAVIVVLACSRKTVGIALLVAFGMLVGCQRSADTRTPEEHFALALDAIEQNDNPAMAVHLAALEDVPGFEPHVHLLRGALSMQAGNNSPEMLEFARKELMLARQHEDTRVAACVLIGIKLRDFQEWNQAIMVLKEAEQYNKNYAPTHKWLAAIYYDLGAMQDAHDHLEQISKLDPYNTPSEFTMGVIHQDYRRFDLAEKNFEECLRRLELLTTRPNKLHLPRVNRQEVLLKLAQTRIQLREYEKADKALDQALESRAVLSLKAICSRSLDRADEARAQLDRALKQFADDPVSSVDEDRVYQEARRLKGTMLLEAKQFVEARTDLETLCEEYPFDEKSLYVLVQVYTGLGLKKEADEKLLIYKPLRAKRERSSVLHIEAANQPENADVRYEIGKLALELGEIRLAHGWFQAALSIDPQHAKTMQTLDELYGVPTEQDPGQAESREPAAKEPAAKEPAAKVLKF